MKAGNSFIEVTRFGIVGLAATAMHYLVLTVLVELVRIPPTPANGLAFLCALGITYLGQSLRVFRKRSQHGVSQVLRFIVSLAVGLLSNMAIMAISVHAFKLDYQTGFLLALIFVPMLSFMINRSWVFREPQRG